MILERLTLENFCLYGGRQGFELTPARRRGRVAPIVLFGGINGGGKTTLLDAVQLCLYGNRATCSKRNERPYEEFLRESIHHGVRPEEGASITLAFRYATAGEEQRYEVTRSWSAARGRVRERVSVRRDGAADQWMAENWNQLVEELIPLGIAQLCFFDAEKIRFLAEDETSTQALGEAIKSLLGLDLAERLVADAAVLESRIAKRLRSSPDLEEVRREEELAAKQDEIDKLVQEQASLENPRLRAKERLKQAEERFAAVGGRHWEQRETRKRQKDELENEIRESEERLVGLASGELPLALVGELLEDTLRQAERERRSAEAEVIQRLLSERDERLLEVLKAKRVGEKATEVVRLFLEEDRANRAGEEAGAHLGLSDHGLRMLERLVEDSLPERCASAGELLQRLDTAQRRLAETQRALMAAPEEESLAEVAEELKGAAAELGSLDQQAERLKQRLEGLRRERDELEHRLQKLRRKVVDAEIGEEENARLARLAARTQETMREFLRRATAAKIERLSRLVTESFRFLLRKKSLIERVAIDPQSFAITLYDQAGTAIPKQRLSEGEKQIFAVSVLWGLSRAAARPLPAIIDTPMARLDAQHRNQLVERYFPHASHQVIVLSTDTEIERRYFQQLQPHIARAYHLDYDEARKVTVGREGYFWEYAGEEAAV